jgi:hypothetical protein
VQLDLYVFGGNLLVFILDEKEQARLVASSEAIIL